MLNTLRRKLSYFTLFYRPEDYWNKKADLFEKSREHPEIRRMQEAQERFILRLLEEHKPKTLLEVGCGYGRILALIENRFPEIELTGFDISGEMVKRAKCKVKHANIFKSPIDTVNLGKRFDLVLSVKTLQHVKPKDLGKSLQAIREHTGGHFLLIEDRTVRPLARNIFSHDYGAALKKAGFQIIGSGKVRNDTYFFCRSKNIS